jgi:predicted RNA binding protein YcfA (HicA-like mRNA interferase family)
MQFPSEANASGTILITDPGTVWHGEGGGSHVNFGHSSGSGSVTVRVANAAVMHCGKAPEYDGGVKFLTNCTFIIDDATFQFCDNSSYEYMTVAGGAKLTGKGLIEEFSNDNSTLFMNGTLAPGLSVGTITAKVNVVNMLETSSILQAELTSTTSHDQFVVTDAGNPTTVNLDSDARVEVTPLNPETFTLKAGDIFDLIVADDVDVSGGLPGLSFQGPEAASFAGTLTEVAGTPEALRLTLTAAPVPPPTGTVFKVR